MVAFPSGQPALGPVLTLRFIEAALLLTALIWAVLDKNFPTWVPPISLAINCFMAIAIVAGSRGHRILSIAIFLVDGAQFLLAFGFFIRRQWITILSGLGLWLGAAVLFLILPRSTFPQELSAENTELGFMFLLFFGLALITGFVTANNSIARRITDRAKDIAAKLREVAFQDSATGLPNGLQLEQDMKDWGAAPQVDSLSPGVLVLAGFRLDGLEELNESQGVEITTQIVAEIAKDYALELNESTGSGSKKVRTNVFKSLYRVESNLFLFAFSNTNQTQPILISQNTLSAVIEQVVARKTFEIRLDFQGGFTVFPDDATTLRQLLRNLLNLLHSRRAEHRGKFVPFNPDLYREYLRQDELRLAMAGSLINREFRLVYQPKVNISTGLCSGFEALARWSVTGFGPVSPVEFIPLAEQTGQITELTSQLLDQAFTFIVELKAAGFSLASVAVNLSPGVFVPEFLDTILDRLNANKLGAQLEIEITEGVLMRLSDSLHDRFSRLKTLGVSFSIDDFGTGYSNLGYLQTLEADVLKIDKSFIDGVPNDDKNSKLVTAIVQMSHSLGMVAVAEGVEYQEQRDFLSGVGCDQIQGYFYSKPLEPTLALAYIRKHSDGA